MRGVEILLQGILVMHRSRQSQFPRLAQGFLGMEYFKGSNTQLETTSDIKHDWHKLVTQRLEVAMRNLPPNAWLLCIFSDLHLM